MNTVSNIGLDFRLSIAYVCIAFVVYYTLVFSLKKRKPTDGNNTAAVLLGRFAGFVLFGIIPFLCLLATDRDISKFGVNVNHLQESFFSFLILLPILFLISLLNAKKEHNLKQYPEIRKPSWSFGLLLLSGCSWILYILAYEFLFRGFLLFISLHYFTYLPAVFINIVLYAAAHIPKGMKETVASLPFGIVLCIITIETGSLSASIAIHASLALMNEWFSLRAHPDIQLK